MTDDEPTRRPARPALKTLVEDQQRMLDGNGTRLSNGLREGFAHRREVIEWYQAATVRTLGHLHDHWSPSTLATDDALLAALITGPARQNWVADPPGLEWAREQRRELERQVVLPACNEAHAYLRKRAAEYLGDEEDIDPEDLRHPDEQESLAMRPGFQEKDREQRHALQTLWGGFEDEDALTSWIHWLNVPTFGELDVESARDIGLDEWATACLLGNGVPAIDARRFRERFAIGVEAGDRQIGLLPAFANGISEMNAGELARRERDGVQTLRMGGSK